MCDLCMGFGGGCYCSAVVSSAVSASLGIRMPSSNGSLICSKSALSWHLVTMRNLCLWKNICMLRGDGKKGCLQLESKEQRART